MSIADYPELISEATERTQLTGLATRGGQYVRFAENALNKRLRLAGMETVATLTPADGVITLPDDWLEERSVKVGNTTLHPVSNTEIDCVTDGYWVSGDTMLTARKSADHDVIYFAALPGLEANGTNFLLKSEPELYLNAVIYQALVAVMDERAVTMASILRDQIADIEVVDRQKRYSSTRIREEMVP